MATSIILSKFKNFTLEQPVSDNVINIISAMLSIFYIMLFLFLEKKWLVYS